MMPREAASERPRGRRPVFSEDELRHAAQFAYARRVRTRRGAQDLVYRKFAVAVIELYREAHPVEGAPLEWLLRPMPRYSLLSELGRVANRNRTIDAAPAIPPAARTAVLAGLRGEAGRRANGLGLSRRVVCGSSQKAR